MGKIGGKKVPPQSGDRTALVRLQRRIARCADMLARKDRAKTLPITLDKTFELWMQAEKTLLETQTG